MRLLALVLLLVGCAHRDYLTEHGSCREFALSDTQHATVAVCADW